MATTEPRREDSLEGRLLLWAADGLTALLLTAGTTLASLSAYDIKTDLGAVLAFCVLASAVSTAVHSVRRKRWAVLLAAGILLTGFLARESVLPVLDWLGMKAGLLRIGSSVQWKGEAPLLPVLLLLCAVLAWLMGWLTVWGRAWPLAAALSILPLLPAIQRGTLPAWGAMLACFIGWGTLLLTSLFTGKDAGSLGRARFLSLGGMTALVLVLVMALPMEGYTRPQWATDARNSMIRSVTRQLDRFFDLEELGDGFLSSLGLDLSIPNEGAGTGYGPGTGFDTFEIIGSVTGPREDLLNMGPRRTTDRLVLSVSTDQPNPAGRMYLRGGSFSFYTGTSWESGGLPDAAAAAERFPAQTAPDAPSYTMRVRDTSFLGVWYCPYRYGGGGLIDADGRLTLERGGESGMEPVVGRDGLLTEEYRVSYRPGGPEDGFVPLPEAVFVPDQVYLDIPAGLQPVLEPRLEDLRREDVEVDSRLPEQFQQSVSAAARTAAYLASIAEYDPDTPAMEEGEDFVAHFLEEGRGYCVHFATAGAMLLRMQGIPARYVSGYAATLDGQGRGTVRDGDAHAWVEIYLEGYGWYPVEMTPGYTGGISGVELSGAPEIPEEDESALEEPDEKPEEVPDEEDAPDGETPETRELPEEGSPEEAAVAIPWRLLFGIALFWAVLCAAYLLASLARGRAQKDGDTNRSVLNAYRRYLRLRRWGCGEDEELEVLARKAKFSQHTLTEKEREAAWKCLAEDVKQSKVGQPRRRRWMLALLEPVF